jgi:GYF domain 2
MNSGWHLMRDGKKLGPVSPDQLQRLARDGRLRGSDLVCREGSSSWVAAGSVPGLFSVSTQVAPPAPSPLPTPESPSVEVQPGRVAGTSLPGGYAIRVGLCVLGALLAFIGVCCPWYSVVEESSTSYGGASLNASTSGWLTIPGVLVFVVSLPALVFGCLPFRWAAIPASALGLVIVLLAIWGIFYAPSSDVSVGASVDFQGLGYHASGFGRAGFSWGVWVTMLGGLVLAFAPAPAWFDICRFVAATRRTSAVDAGQSSEDLAGLHSRPNPSLLYASVACVVGGAATAIMGLGERFASSRV